MLLASDRVIQLKKEIEELDNKLMSTNTINFQELRSSKRVSQHDGISRHNFENEEFSSDEEEFKKTNQSIINYDYSNKNYEIEQELLKQSQGRRSPTSQQYVPTSNIGRENWKQIRTIEDRMNDNLIQSQVFYQTKVSTGNWKDQVPQNLINTSHISNEGEVSFDLEKIIQKRNLNIKNAFQSNLKEKTEFMSGIQTKISNIRKECDAKTLKLAHLKYERDNIINQIQYESLKKKEQQKEAKEQFKRIEIKRKEDERAFELAQKEIQRCMGQSQKVLDNLYEEASIYEKQLKEAQQSLSENNRQSFAISAQQHELQERINQQQTKIQSLTTKKLDVETNVQILKEFLRQISEEIQMTQEDLSGKLMQRAEQVAQREELDQMYETGKKAFGRSFEIYLKINQCDSNSARFLVEDYENAKSQSFFVDILQQLRQTCKSKYYEMIDQLQQRIEQSASLLDVDKTISAICNLAQTLGILLDKKLLNSKLMQSSKEKDLLFERRQVQLRGILEEIRQFEKLIKENSNLVDNMILPQLKAMTTTYNEHKGKYKKLKQACFVLKERLKRAEKDLQILIEEKGKYQVQQNVGTKIKHFETELQKINEKIKSEQEEMDRLNENAQQIDREFRRAQQALLLKEREIMHKFGLDTNFNGTQSQLQSSMNLRNEQEEERLKKRFKEIEDKIKLTQKEKDDLVRKLNDYEKLLKEAEESLQHAEQSKNQNPQLLVMISTQRIIESSNGSYSAKVQNQNNFNTLPNNRRHYKEQKNEDFSQEYQITSQTDTSQEEQSNFGSSTNFNYKSSIENPRLSHQNSVSNNNNQNIHLKSNSQHYNQSIKSNPQSQKENQKEPKSSKDTVTKIDLSKILAHRDNQENVRTPIQQQNKNNKPSFNDKNNNSSTDISNVNNLCNSQHSHATKDSKQMTIRKDFLQQFCSKNATQGTHLGTQINDDLLNLLQQSKLTDSQLNNSNISILNLSDLLFNNNAVQNLLNSVNTQNTRSSPLLASNLIPDHENQYRPISQLTFNNTENQQLFDQTQIQQKIGLNQGFMKNSNIKEEFLDNPTIINRLQSQDLRFNYSGIYNQDVNNLQESGISQSQILQFNNSKNQQLSDSSKIEYIMGVNNSSNIADTSLVQCLNEINNGIKDQYRPDDRIKSQSQLKRSSIDTADFFQNQDEYAQFKHIQTLEVDSMNPVFVQKRIQAAISPDIKGERKRTFLRQTANNQQEIVPERQRSNQKQNWMSKYLSNVNESSRMDALSGSISPKPICKRPQVMRFMSHGQNQYLNRSISQENKFNHHNNRMNMSMNSISSSCNFNSLHNQSCNEALNRSNSRIIQKKNNRKLNKSLNNAEYSMIMQQSINSSMMNPVNMSLNLNNMSLLKNSGMNQHQYSCNVSLEQDFYNFSKVEVLFAERIVPLLDGTAFYKKFSSRQSLNENAFDPLNAEKFPPENCGYGIRAFQLDKSLMQINIKQSLKNAVEHSISLNDIVKPILPQTTMDIIKAQKQFQLHQANSHLRKSSRNGQLCHINNCNQPGQNIGNSSKDLLEEFLILDTKGSISHLAKIGIVNKNSELYRQKCLDSTFYPFSIALTKGRVELIATSYETLKNWIIGINLLVSNKKHIPKLRQMMELRFDQYA